MNQFFLDRKTWPFVPTGAKGPPAVTLTKWTGSKTFQFCSYLIHNEHQCILERMRMRKHSVHQHTFHH